MKPIDPKLIREAGQDRKIERLAEPFKEKWQEFFALSPQLAQIQRFIDDSEQLCLSEEYYVNEDLLLVGPSIFWNKKHGLLIMVDYFEGIAMGFLIRRELVELMGWRSTLRFQKNPSPT